MQAEICQRSVIIVSRCLSPQRLRRVVAVATNVSGGRPVQACIMHEKANNSIQRQPKRTRQASCCMLRSSQPVVFAQIFVLAKPPSSIVMFGLVGRYLQPSITSHVPGSSCIAVCGEGTPKFGPIWVWCTGPQKPNVRCCPWLLQRLGDGEVLLMETFPQRYSDACQLSLSVVSRFLALGGRGTFARVAVIHHNSGGRVARVSTLGTASGAAACM